MRLQTLGLSLLISIFSLQGQEIQIQILSTTDMHGRILPSDTYSLLPLNQGWAKIATLIKEERAKNPNTLLLDAGDTIQGEPINYVRTFVNPTLAEPSIDIMNSLGYQAMAVGNHEYNFGLSNLRQVQKQAQFSFLSANTLVEKTGRPAFDSYRSDFRLDTLRLRCTTLVDLRNGHLSPLHRDRQYRFEFLILARRTPQSPYKFPSMQRFVRAHGQHRQRIQSEEEDLRADTR